MKKLFGLFSVLVVLLLLPGVCLAQRYNASFLAGISSGVIVISLIFAALMIATMWRIFTKAGKPGWASIVPIYNMVVMLQISGKPEWWILLFFIPLVNIVIAIMVIIAMAEAFGQSTGFAMGMLFLPIIFYPLLAFGDYEYQG